MKQQASALPYRVNADGKVEILLITSKRSGKWLIPKGHVEPQEELVEAAAREALEEAGVKGEISPHCLGSYIYKKGSKKYDVRVYPLEVKEQLDEWEEHKLRNRQWYQQAEAARIVKNADVGKIITSF
ncbi:MAG: NUDIX hydrolase [Pseudomonadota bacterium]